VLPLAMQAYKEHLYQLTLQMTKDFENLYPEHDDIIAIAFLRIQAFTELGQYVDAITAIKQLLEYKKHPLYPDIKAHAILLMKLKNNRS